MPAPVCMVLVLWQLVQAILSGATVHLVVSLTCFFMSVCFSWHWLQAFVESRAAVR